MRERIATDAPSEAEVAAPSTQGLPPVWEAFFASTSTVEGPPEFMADRPLNEIVEERDRFDTED